ncbi:replicative DNA helicase [Spiroplasma endosymbiont of Lonchoptera lutea]|uniref:replicative DNA helicase n=1 Tax=Spiroplasma endosymbiont of Lonchoptera lutea TaxID=3066297 RepID=UPI0030CBCE33
MTITNNFLLEDAEVSVLAAVINSKNASDEVVALLNENDFINSRHKLIFKAIISLYNHQLPIDLPILTDMLVKQQSLNQAGGVEYLTLITQSYISDANLDDYLKIIVERTMLRNLQVVTQDITKKINTEISVWELLGIAERQILEIANNRKKNEFKSTKDVVDATLSKIEKLQNSDNQLTGSDSGFMQLNKITNGFQNGDFIILAARPSMGKTALALNFAVNCARVYKDSAVVIFSLEMPTEQLILRILGSETKIGSMQIKTGKNLTSRNWQDLTSVGSKLKQSNIFIDDSPGLRVIELISKLRKLSRNYDLKLVVIDYLQLLAGDGENRQQEISNISRSLKALARELEVPIVCLSQLSRKVESREDKRPLMSDLRESGAIEQDADLIMFLYREDYYEKKEDSLNEESHKAQLIISKHRNGPTGIVELLFLQKYGNFIDYNKTVNKNEKKEGTQYEKDVFSN